MAFSVYLLHATFFDDPIVTGPGLESLGDLELQGGIGGRNHE